MNNFHTPVLLKEVLDFLQVKEGKKYIDATLGGGGHTKGILELGGRVLGIDQDREAIDYVSKNEISNIENQKLFLEKGNFKDLNKIARLKNFDKVSGILFDLGVSSHQIDTPQRGFSFLKDGPLDMRMDNEAAVTAEILVNLLEKGELYELFNNLGQERRSWSISNSIVRARRVKAIKTTGDLEAVVEQAYGIKAGKASDFTKNLINRKVFQALRIAVNQELENLSEALPKAEYLLEEKGRIVAISFHSLEDKIIKNVFKDFEKKNLGKIITEKPVLPGREEILNNSRAKPAKLRVFEKN